MAQHEGGADRREGSHELNVRRLCGMLRQRFDFMSKSLIAGAARETIVGVARAGVVTHAGSIQSINRRRARTATRAAIIAVKQERARVGALISNRLLGAKFLR